MTVDEFMTTLEACWCDLLNASANPVSFCCISAGVPAIVDCCGGFAWVRLVGAYPSVAFPQHVTTTQRNCLIDTWALQVEVGVTRCAPQPCEIDQNLCCAAAASSAQIIQDDFNLMRRLLSCGCLGLSSDQILPGQWTVYGPEGGCVGSKMTLTVRIVDSCAC